MKGELTHLLPLSSTCIHELRRARKRASLKASDDFRERERDYTLSFVFELVMVRKNVFRLCLVLIA